MIPTKADPELKSMLYPVQRKMKSICLNKDYYKLGDPTQLTELACNELEVWLDDECTIPDWAFDLGLEMYEKYVGDLP